MTDFTKTTGDPNVDGLLGCGVGLALIAFFVWLIFLREPDEEWKATVDREVVRVQEGERIKRENAKRACDAGVQSACVEYAELID